jgi:DNA-binding NarL/FixJ family response regulator
VTTVVDMTQDEAGAARPVRVVVVDDHPIVRSGLAGLLAAQDGVELVCAVDSGEAAVAAIDEHDVDVVLMDLQLPGIDGIEATRRVIARRGPVAVVVLTSFSDRTRILDAFDAGAVGYVLKDAGPEELVAAVLAASRGESPMGSRAARALVEDRASSASGLSGESRAWSAPMYEVRGTGDDAGPTRLTARELEVLGLLRDGLPNKTIARRLGISEATVKAHLTSVFQRLGVRDRTQAALWMQSHAS